MKIYRDKIATKKQAFISAKLESARSNDVKEKFRCLSNLLSGKARKTLPTHTCDYSLANDFQHYFIQKINNIVNLLDKPVIGSTCLAYNVFLFSMSWTKAHF